MASKANSEFGWCILTTLARDSSNDGQNLFFSPFSISMALAMTHLGARNDTATAMEKALCWSGDGQRIHEDYLKYLKKLQQNNIPNPNCSRPTVRTANRIYIEEVYKILDSFLDQGKMLYLAKPESAEFRKNSDGERAKINSWVEEQTEGKIRDLIQQGSIGQSTAMVLVNAIYLKGKWFHKFNESCTRPQDFYASSSSKKSVPMMHMTEKLGYFKATDYALLELSYEGRELSMVVLLPDERFGLKALEQRLSIAEIKNSLSKLDFRSKVNVSLPKFEINYSMEMKSILCQIGMEIAFDYKTADFSGMTGAKALYISQVVHKSFLKVEESGTEAAAATAVTMLLGCTLDKRVEQPKRFVADHPFLVIIRDKSDDMILFIGNVNDPSV